MSEVKAVQRMLGHASAAMTLDVYAVSSQTIWTPLRRRLMALLVLPHLLDLRKR